MTKRIANHEEKTKKVTGHSSLLGGVSTLGKEKGRARWSKSFGGIGGRAEPGNLEISLERRSNIENEKISDATEW